MCGLLFFAANDFSGTYAYWVKDRATKQLLTSGTIMGSNGCTTITIPPVKGVAIFSGPGVTNNSNGLGYFHPDVAGPGTHTIKYYFNNSIGYKDSSTITVTVLAPPVFTVNNPTIVTGCLATLDATGNLQKYVWSDGQSGNPITVSPGSTTLYYVTGTDVHGCTGIDSSLVTVVQQANISVNSPTICAGDSAILKATGAESYTWSTGQVADSIVVRPNTTTIYTVTGSIPSCNINTSAQAVVTVNPAPVVKVTGTTVCFGQNAVINATAGLSAYLWSTGDTTSIINVAPLTTTTYTVTASSSSSCYVIASGVVMVQAFLPPPDVSSNSPVCAGNTLTLSATDKDTTAIYTYHWIGPFNYTSNLQNIVINNVSSSASGNYYASASINNCSSADTSLYITVNPLPSGFLRSDTSICGTVSFVASVIGNYINYLWQNGSLNTSIQISDFGVYWLKVTDSLNCTSTDTLHVLSNCTPIIYVPNAFIPLSKSENNTFAAKGSYITQFSMDIFDRWGGFIFHSDDLNTGWNGKYNNNNCPLGVYIYVINYEGLVNDQTKKYTKTGSFTLVR